MLLKLLEEAINKMGNEIIRNFSAVIIIVIANYLNISLLK
jgi:hypothetical protein